jgi:ABC-type transport system involved in multi-copper enzyme maturation permease subunit
MNALVKKEIRLLLPGWLAVLLLEALQPWFWNEPDATYGVAPVIFFFGIIILAVDSFGREFSLGTFQSLLAQPMERRQIWRTKIKVLFTGATFIYAAYFASCYLRLHQGLKNPLWHANPAIIGSDFRNAMFGSVAALLVALTGGLWTALLLRQLASAFWITFLAPAVLLMAIAIIMSQFFISASDDVVCIVLYVAAALYSILGFWLAHRMFHRAQDAGWTGGTISFSNWRYFEAGSKLSVSTRHHKPITALIKKEFQLQSISLFCAGALLALHIGVFIERVFYANFHKNSFADGVSDFFWMLWLVMPLVIGGTAVAEERKLGVSEQQFCLPVSRRTQFAIKFILTLIFGVLLGGVMPLLMEGVAAQLGAPCDFFKPEDHAGNEFASGIVWFRICIVSGAAGLSLVAFFASTLARNFMQALSLAIVTIIGCCLLGSFAVHISEYGAIRMGIALWPSALPIIIAIPTMTVLSFWLVYRNFCYFHEGWHLWRRNIAGIIGSLLFVFVSSALIYNRAWEVFEPVEPAHGAAKLSLAHPPKLQREYDNLQVRLPDGRVWLDSLENFYDGNQYGVWKRLWRTLVRPLPESTGPQEFVDGSNWQSVAARHVDWSDDSENHRVLGYLDTVGIKSDGTLWISSKSDPKTWTGKQMMQFDEETNWQQVSPAYGYFFGSFMLLKTDGTLWFWGSTNHYDASEWRTNWPSVRTFQPRQIGTNSDWKQIFNGWAVNAQKTNGSAWVVAFNFKSGKDVIEHRTNYDQIVPQTFSWSGENAAAYVANDGTLWVCNRYQTSTFGWSGTGFLQVGKETNWVAVAITWNTMVALKSDGTLWKWNLSTNSKATAEILQTEPTRLGIHSDWVGLTGTWVGAISLAADGSLWFWPKTGYDEPSLLKAPKQPKFLGNIFGNSD